MANIVIFSDDIFLPKVNVDMSNMQLITAKTVTHSVCTDNPSLTVNSWFSSGSVWSWIWRWTICWSFCGVITCQWPGRGQSLVVPVCWYVLWSLVIVEWCYSNHSTQNADLSIPIPHLSTVPSLVQCSLKIYFIKPPSIVPISMICRFNICFSCYACNMLCFGVVFHGVFR